MTWTAYYKEDLVETLEGLFFEGPIFDILGLLVHFVKNWQVFFFYFGMNLPKDGTKPLDKDGFDWIALSVIFQGQKGINLSLCSHVDTYCLFIPSLCGKF